MKRVFKKYFVPHEENDWKPHFLRKRAVFGIAGIVVILFLVSLLQTTALRNLDFLASILPDVLVDLANSDRAGLGTITLKTNPILEAAAKLKAEDMARGSYFAHVSPDGKTPWYWFSQAGYRFTHAGENLAIDFSDSGEVERAWMNSPLHRANLLNKNFTEIGIATAKGVYQGRETTFVVQLFGRPAQASAPYIALDSSGRVPANTPTPRAETPRVGAPTPLGVGVEITEEKDLFIAVANHDELEKEVAAATPVSEEPKSNFIERFLASPKALVNYSYLILGALVFIALLFAVFVEVERRHPKHVLYAASLLTLMAALAYISNEFIFSAVSVI